MLRAPSSRLVSVAKVGDHRPSVSPSRVRNTGGRLGWEFIGVGRSTPGRLYSPVRIEIHFETQISDSDRAGSMAISVERRRFHGPDQHLHRRAGHTERTQTR